MANRPQDGSEPKVRDAVFLPPRLWQWLDAQRGTVSRSKYLAEMLKAQLERQDSRAVRAAGAIPAEEPAISEGRLPGVVNPTSGGGAAEQARTAKRAVLAEAIANFGQTPVADVVRHEFRPHEEYDWEVCERCGEARSQDTKNQPCTGETR